MRRRMAAIALIAPAVAAAMSHIALHRYEADKARLVLVADTFATVARRELDLTAAKVSQIATSPAIKRHDLATFETFLRKVSSVDGRAYILVDRSFTQLINTSAGDVSKVAPRTVSDLEAVFAGAESVVTNLRLNRYNGKHQFGVRVPVWVENRIDYVLTVLAEPEALQQAIERPPLDEETFVGVVDQSGTTIARRPGGEPWIGKNAPPEVRARMAESNGGVLEFTDNTGLRSLTAFASVAGTGWKVGAWSRISAPVDLLWWVRAVALAFLGLGLAAVPVRYLMSAPSQRS